MSIASSSSGQSTIWVRNINPGCSASSTVASVYGIRSTQNGWNGCVAIVQLYSVAFPETRSPARSCDWQNRQMTFGKWM